ncbi:MAG: hypothetical protein D6732_13735 [Methanobacteriota archaeon]|nr:MAG: hypothetical protein D6732_13735 [Euryarchaeota archaeon]
MGACPTWDGIKAAGQFIADNVLLPILQEAISGLMGFVHAILETVAALIPGFTANAVQNGVSLTYGSITKTFSMRVANSLEIEVLVDNQVVYRITNFFLLPQASFAFDTLSPNSEMGQVGLFLATYGLNDLAWALTFALTGSADGAFSEVSWGNPRSGYVATFLLMTITHIGWFFALSPEERRQFAEDMIILHSAAVFAFSIMDLIKEVPYANPSNGKSQVFYRKLFSLLVKIIGGGFVLNQYTGKPMNKMLLFAKEVVLTYGMGLTAILAFLLVKTTAQGAATAGLFAIKEAITTIRPWFEFLETMRTFHYLMMLIWFLLAPIGG